VITASPFPYDCGENWRWGSSYADYTAYKTEVARVLLARTEEYLPGLSEHVEVAELATPVTIEQYTLNPEGSWAGWEIEYGVEHPDTTAMDTPIEGLYQTGAWVTGAGQSVVLSSGIAVAEEVLGELEVRSMRR
jgi:phytoene dehydrogenase-like protein